MFENSSISYKSFNLYSGSKMEVNSVSNLAYFETFLYLKNIIKDAILKTELFLNEMYKGGNTERTTF